MHNNLKTRVCWLKTLAHSKFGILKYCKNTTILILRLDFSLNFLSKKNLHPKS